MELALLIIPFINFYLANKNGRNPWLWAVLGLFLSIISTVVLFLIGHSHKNWPTVDEYMATHSESNQGKGIFCIKCGSRSIRSWGVSNTSDARRLHICNSCNSGLYRSGF
jgi:hypothetical protein